MPSAAHLLNMAPFVYYLLNIILITIIIAWLPHLGDGVHKRPQLGAVVVGGQGACPEFQAVDVLPVVALAEGLLRALGERGTHAHGQLGAGGEGTVSYGRSGGFGWWSRWHGSPTESRVRMSKFKNTPCLSPGPLMPHCIHGSMAMLIATNARDSMPAVLACLT